MNRGSQKKKLSKSKASSVRFQNVENPMERRRNGNVEESLGNDQFICQQCKAEEELVEAHIRENYGIAVRRGWMSARNAELFITDMIRLSKLERWSVAETNKRTCLHINSISKPIFCSKLASRRPIGKRSKVSASLASCEEDSSSVNARPVKRASLSKKKR